MEKKKNKTLLWIGLFGLLTCCLSGFCVAGVGTYVGVQSRLEAPALMARAFLRDVCAGRHESALRRTDGDYQSSHSEVSFREAIEAIPGFRTGLTVEISDTLQTGDQATVHAFLTTGADYGTPATVQLTELAGHWYVTQVTIDGVRLP